jgi:dephospho-CoA kinase
MMRVGITGGIGSGKTTICRIFEFLGVPVYYADAETKKLYAANTTLREDLAAEFGSAVLTDSGVNRELLRRMAFGNPEVLQKLNAIVHPYVFEHYEQWCSAHEKFTYTLKEAAILFESGSYKRVHAAIGVVAPDELRIQRTLLRDGLSREQIQTVISKQLSQSEIEKRCDYVIYNDGTHSLISQVLKVHHQLMIKAAEPHDFLT